MGTIVRAGRWTHRRAQVIGVLAVAIMAAACGSGTRAGHPIPSVTPGELATLKLLVLRALGGHLSYCDPDIYPVAFGSPVEAAKRSLFAPAPPRRSVQPPPPGPSITSLVRSSL